MANVVSSASRMIGALVARFQNNDFLKNISLLAGGTILAQLVVVASTPIATRYFSSSQFGELSLFVSFISFAIEVVSLRFQYAIVGAESDDDAASLTIFSIYLSLFLSIVLSYGFYHLVKANLIGFGILPQWVVYYVLPVCLISSSTAAVRFYLIRHNNFASASLINVYQSIGRASAQIVFGIAQLGLLGLLLSEVVARGLSLAVALRNIRVQQPLLIRNINPIKIFHSVKKYYQFPLYSLPSSILDSLSFTLLIPIIVSIYGSSAAGNFSLAQRIIAIPFGLISSSIADAFHGQISLFMQQDPKKIYPFLLKTVRTLLLLGLLPSVLIMVFAPSLFGFIFGLGWESSGIFAAIITPWMLIGLAVSPVSRLLFVLGGQQYKLFYDVFAIFSTIFAFYGCHYLGFGMVITLMVWTFLQILAYGIYFMVLVFVSKRVAAPSR